MSTPQPGGPDGQRRGPWRRAWLRWVDRIAVVSDVRQHWWDFLTAFEDQRALRVKIYATVFLLLAAGAAGAWGYPRWRERRAISVARQWLAVGKLERAGPAVDAALHEAPNNAEAWTVAAEFAQRVDLKARSAAYARRAAELAPARTDLALAWASRALAAGRIAECHEALARVPAVTQAASAWAQRLIGELARQNAEPAAARSAFEAALRLGGGEAVNELPLGLVLIAAESPADRSRGAALLEKWTADPAVGADALRALLEDAVVRDDRPVMMRRADALRKHPAHSRADLFNALLALGRADALRFHTALAEAEREFVGDPAAIAELLTWLTGNKWFAEARAWVEALPPAVANAIPVVSQRAELLRVVRDWAALERLTKNGDWTAKLDFLRQAYAALAARELGDRERAATLWRGLLGSAEIRGGQGFFLAGVLYTWGWREEAVELWWIGADQGGLAVQALGALARHYQLAGDAAGSLKVFRRLHGLRASDAAVANNYVYFEALAGQPTRATRELARELHEQQPQDARFRSTYAFVLLRQSAAAEALALLSPVAEELKRAPSLAFTYGLVLAANGRKAEARAVFEAVEAGTLMPAERELLNSARAP